MIITTKSRKYLADLVGAEVLIAGVLLFTPDDIAAVEGKIVCATPEIQAAIDAGFEGSLAPGLRR